MAGGGKTEVRRLISDFLPLTPDFCLPTFPRDDRRNRLRQSRVGMCLIADDRTKRKFDAIVVKGGEGNVTDVR